jgi:hypothetical protein
MYVNGKTKPVESVQRMDKGEMKENEGEGEFNYDIL